MPAKVGREPTTQGETIREVQSKVSKWVYGALESKMVQLSNTVEKSQTGQMCQNVLQTSNFQLLTKLTIIQRPMVWTHLLPISLVIPSKATESPSINFLDQERSCLSFLLTKVVAPAPHLCIMMEAHYESKHSEASTGPNKFVRCMQHKCVHALIFCPEENLFWFSFRIRHSLTLCAESTEQLLHFVTLLLFIRPLSLVEKKWCFSFPDFENYEWAGLGGSTTLCSPWLLHRLRGGGGGGKGWGGALQGGLSTPLPSLQQGEACRVSTLTREGILCVIS